MSSPQATSSARASMRDSAATASSPASVSPYHVVVVDIASTRARAETPRPADVTVELLYLDREACDRCRATEAALDGALSTVRPALALAGAGVSVDRIHVDSLATAREHGFEASPTDRIDGRDVQPDFETTDCGCATDGTVPCRVWRHRGETHEAAPADLLADAVLRAAYGGSPRDRDTATSAEVIDGGPGCC